MITILKYIALILLFTVVIFFSYFNISEWYNIEILEKTGGYPWGKVNDNPWYYKNPMTYAYVNLLFGILYFLTALLIAYFSYKKHKRGLIYTLIGFITIFLFMVINASIK